jgi:kynureninase
MGRFAFEPGIAGARALDADDELAGLRGRFALPRSGRRPLAYLCGHSLGAMPKHAPRAVQVELDRWAAFGVEGHSADNAHGGWIDYHEQFAKPLAALCGSRRGEVVAMNTLTVNLHLMLASFFRPTAERYKILIERGAFPSDRYAHESQLAYHGLDAADALLEVPCEPDGRQLDVAAYERVLASDGERIALVLLPGVQYLTGERLDIERLTAAAHAAGCRAGFDLAHAIGNVPLALHDAGPDFAVWCSYKYLNAGPGAVGGCFVHERWAEAPALPRFAGWWGHDRARRFFMEDGFVPMRGAPGWQLSNPPILSLAPLTVSLELFAAAGNARLRRKSEKLTAYLEHCLRSQLGERIEILTPREPARRGAMLAVRFEPAPGNPQRFMQALRAAGVVADWRRPDVLRLTPVPLYNTFAEVFRAVGAIERALAA